MDILSITPLILTFPALIPWLIRPDVTRARLLRLLNTLIVVSGVVLAIATTTAVYLDRQEAAREIMSCISEYDFAPDAKALCQELGEELFPDPHIMVLGGLFLLLGAVSILCLSADMAVKLHHGQPLRRVLWSPAAFITIGFVLLLI